MKNFQDLIVQLDDAQRQGVMAGPGLVAISAGAGTGKTHVLTTRILNLVKNNNVPADSIVSVTFTNKAAKEMKERAILFGGADISKVKFGTIHSLASRIIREGWYLIGLQSDKFFIADEDESRILMYEAILESGLIDVEACADEKELSLFKKEAYKICHKMISSWKEKGLTLDIVNDENREKRSQEEEMVARVYALYQRNMLIRNMVDFSDLTMMAVSILENNPEFKEHYTAPINWLMIDEFQDTNPVQLKLLRLLASNGANVTVVGDDDQSIYSFRHAVPHLMERVEEFFPLTAQRGLYRVNLITNRRCTDDILRPANLLVDYNPREEPKILQSGRKGEEVMVSSYASELEELDAISLMIQKDIDNGIPADDIAVLARTSDILAQFSAILSRKRIPHSVQSGVGFLESSEILDVLAYFKLAIDPHFDLAFRRIHSRPTRGLGAVATDLILNTALEKRLPLWSSLLLYSDAKSGLRSDARASAQKFSDHLYSLHKAFQEDADSERLVSYVLDTIGYRDWCYRENQDDGVKMRKLKTSFDFLIDTARATPDLVEFLTSCGLLQEVEDVVSSKDIKEVHLGTLHGSKGLEWSHVYLPAFEENIIPSPKSLEEAKKSDRDETDPWNLHTGGGIEEERRLAHVGLTRAKHKAHISFSTMRQKFGKKQSNKPSRFLKEAELKIPKPKTQAIPQKSPKSSRNNSYF